MPEKAQIVSITVAHVYEDGSKSEYKISSGNNAVTVEQDDDVILFRPESWDEIAQQIDGFMQNLPETETE